MKLSKDTTQTWLVTGCSRGLGLAVARAALEAGHTVVASGRHPERTAKALAEYGGRVRTPRLDVTDGAAIERVVAETIEGRVLVTSSIAGLKGFGGASAYAATKFALEGWAETLAMEVEQFGISVTLSEPGFFRTDFLDASSASYGDVEVADYAEFSARTEGQYDASNHEQPGDPARYAEVVVRLRGEKKPPLRWAAGPDAYQVAQDKAKTLHDDSKALKKLSASTSF